MLPENLKVWKAPESKASGKADVWSVGAIAFWLLMKREPQSPVTSESVQNDIKDLKSGDFSD